MWGLNEITQERADAWFELHPHSVQSEHDLAWLAQCQSPCYVLDIDEWHGLIPHPVRFPLARLRAAGFRDYYTATFCYQIALALLDGFEMIGLYGVELYYGSPRERLVERACVEYWLGVADGRGVEVVNRSGLSQQPYLYGYDYEKEKTYVDSDVASLRREIDRSGAVLDETNSGTCQVCRRVFAVDRNICPACLIELGTSD